MQAYLIMNPFDIIMEANYNCLIAFPLNVGKSSQSVEILQTLSVCIAKMHCSGCSIVVCCVLCDVQIVAVRECGVRALSAAVLCNFFISGQIPVV